MALAVMLLLSGAAGGLLGFVAADDGAAPAEAPAGAVQVFDVPAIRAGDHVSYVTVEGPEQARIAWDVLVAEDIPARNETGVLQWATVLQTFANYTVLGGTGSTTATYLLTPGDPYAFAMTVDRTDDVSSDNTQGTRQVTAMQYFRAGPVGPCWLRNPLQGSSVRTDAPPVAYRMPGCDTWGGSGAKQHMDIVGVNEVDGARYLVVDVLDDDNDVLLIRFVFAEGIPFPVRYELPASRWDPAQQEVHEATGFTRGDGPAIRTAPEILDAATSPGLVFAKGPRGVPRDADTDSPYPFSECLANTLADPQLTELQTFQQDHPNAYVGHARSIIELEGSQRYDSWGYDLTDGNQAIGIWCTRATDASGIQEPTGLLAPLLNPDVHRVGHSAESAEGRYPPPADVGETPTVASALAQWRFMTGKDSDGLAGDAWSFTWRNNAGTRNGEPYRWTTFELEAGHDRSTASATPVLQPTPATQTQTLTTNSARWNTPAPWEEAGSKRIMLRELLRDRTDYVVGPAAAPISTPASSAAVAPAPLVSVRLGAWALPDATTSGGVGIAGVLAGLLYWMWPALKTGAMGLFSRVQGDALLEHPARRRLVDLVAAEPGIHQEELLRRAQVGHGAGDHHLRKLVASGLLQRRATPGFTCYFPPKAGRAIMDAAPALRSPTARAILELHRGEPGILGVEVARRLQVTPATVTYHTSRLRDAGLLGAVADAARAAA